GIRDFHVTGVQTCALPISGCALRRRVDLLDATALSERLHERDTDLRVTLYDECDSTNARLLAEPEVHARVICCELQTAGRGRREIGRASWRERGEVAGVGG